LLGRFFRQSYSFGIRKTFKAERYGAARMKNNARFVASWTLVSVVAQSISAAVAFAAVAVSLTAVVPVILLEACVLSAGQRWILRNVSVELERGWFVATVGGVVLGRYVQFSADSSAAAAAISTWPSTAQIFVGAALGAVVGALMAAPQAYVLARRVPRVWRWIAVRAAAWSVALPALMIAGSWLAAVSGAGLAVLAATMFTTFAVVGAFVGLVEGIGLAALIRFAAGWQDRPTIGAVSRLAGSLLRTTLEGKPK
jgi:hypothetical protein